MKKLEIVLDSDGVLGEPLLKLLPLYNSEYGDNLKLEDITQWELNNIKKPGSDICKYFNQPGFFRNIPVIEGAQYYVEKLIKDGHDVTIGTASPKNGIIDKIDWFEEFFPFVGYENIVPISKKFMLNGDVMLDDGFHNILNSRCTHPVIMNAYWNSSEKYPELRKFKRVYTMKEFYEYVCAVARQEIKAS